MTRTQLIQGYIDLIGAKSYLEIGLGDGQNFFTIRCEDKAFVDPNPFETVLSFPGNSAGYYCTSDEWAEQESEMPESPIYDIIFIDGLHEYTQVLRDIQNAMKYLSPKGLILLHDTNPPDEKTATPLDKLEKYPPDGMAWCGDVWKAVCVLDKYGVVHHTHREDYGLTVIPKQELPEFRMWAGVYRDFDFNRERILNLLPPNTPAVLP